MAEISTHVGEVTSVQQRDTYQELTSKAQIEIGFRWAAFTSSPFTRALALESMGAAALGSPELFGATQPNGRMVEVVTGGYSKAGTLMTESGTSFHSGRLSSHTPELVEGGDEWMFAWHTLNQAGFIAEQDLEDNTGGFIPIAAQRMDGMKQKITSDFAKAVLGNSSGPDNGVMGPTALFSDLANLISVDQDRTVGGILTSNSYWQNGKKQITSIGGGGEMDRPLVMRRSMRNAIYDQMAFAEATNDYMILATQGAYEYYDDLMYADSAHHGGAFGTAAVYDAAGIPNKAFEGNPMLWDPSVTTPYGAVASTEAFYFIHRPSYKISLRAEKNFLWKGWEEPRVHDSQKTFTALLTVRYTPVITARRPHLVCYDLPTNPA